MYAAAGLGLALLVSGTSALGPPAAASLDQDSRRRDDRRRMSDWPKADTKVSTATRIFKKMTGNAEECAAECAARDGCGGSGALSRRGVRDGVLQ